MNFCIFRVQLFQVFHCSSLWMHIQVLLNLHKVPNDEQHLRPGTNRTTSSPGGCQPVPKYHKNDIQPWNNWLLVYLPLWKRLVSWDDYSQSMESHKSHVANHQPVVVYEKTSRYSNFQLVKFKEPQQPKAWTRTCTPGGLCLDYSSLSVLVHDLRVKIYAPDGEKGWKT